MTDRERMIEVIKQAFPQTNEGIADALISAGFISLKTSSEWAREACDILRNIKDDEIKCICEERGALARRAEVAERALLDCIKDSKPAHCSIAVCSKWTRCGDGACVETRRAIFIEQAEREIEEEERK